MNYKVWSGGRGCVFGTAEEAIAMANEIAKKTNEIVAVTKTDKKVTHRWNAKKYCKA